jgi:hypothetical protein
MKQSLSLIAAGSAVVLFAGIASAQEEDAPKDEPKAAETTTSKSDDEIAAEADAEEAEAKAKAEAEANAGLPKEDVEDPRKIRLGLRLGYGLPLGNATGDVGQSDAYSGMIPIWIDAGYMVTPEILVGIYLQYGIAMVADASCPEGLDCSGSNIRFGVQGHYHLGVGKPLDPWLGVGIGYEIAGISFGEGSSSLSGLEFLNLQGGADFTLSDGLTAGPFASFSIGQYSSVGLDPEPPGYSGSIQEKGVHMWFVLGAKGAFAL